MVDLPKVQRRLVVTEAPRAGISAEVAGGPFAMAAKALGTLGEGIESAGVRIAEDEGLRAVQTGPDGKPEFAPQPAFTGRAGEMYNRVGYTRYMAELQNASERDVLDAREKYRGDPAGFDEWSRTYVDDLVAKAPDEKLKAAVKTQLSSTTQQTFRAIKTEKYNLDIERSAETLKRRQSMLENNIVALGQQGATETPEYRSLIADRRAVVAERVGNPLYRYSKEQAEQDQRIFETQGIALSLIGSVRRTAENDAADESGRPLGGLRRAEDLAETVLTDPRLNDLTIEQRHHYYRLAKAEVRALSGENQLLVNQLNAEGQQWRRAIEKGEVDQLGLRDYLQRASEAKAIRGWTVATNAIALNEQLRGWFDRLQPEERNRVQLQLEGRLGNLADRIIRAESGGNPFAQATTSTALGAGQFIERTWLALIQRHRPDLAATSTREELLALRSDPKVSREMVMRNADENWEILARNGARTDDSAVYLAHFLGAGDASRVLKAHSKQPIEELLSSEVIAANPSIFRTVKSAGDLSAWAAKKINVPEIPAQMQMNPAFLNGVRDRQRHELNAGFPNIEKRIRQGETVNDDELEQFGALVFAVGSEEQKNKALELAVLSRAGASITTMSAQQRSNLTLEFSRMFANGSARLESEVGAYTRQLNQTITADYQKDPFDAAVRYGKRNPVPALDFSNPQSLPAALRARVSEQAWITQQEGIGPFSLLRPAEAEALRVQLTQGDAAQAEFALATISQAGTPAAVTATLASEPLKAALNGMILTGDTRRMTAAFVTLDRLWQSNPQQFEASFGKDTYNKLAVWQSNLSYRRPEEIAEMLRKAEDPQVRTVREKLLTTFTDEALKMSDSDLLGHFSRKVLGITYSAAQPAATPVQMQVFRQEFAGIYAALRADGVDQTNATERATKWVSQAWGVSSANGNRLMRRPPENYLPMIDGSHDWARREITNEISRVLGPQFSPVIAGMKSSGAGAKGVKPLVAGANGVKVDSLTGMLQGVIGAPRVAQNWDYALIPDPQTEGEISRLNQWKAANPGKTPPISLAPSYAIAVFDMNKREINLFERGPDMSTEAMPLAGPASSPAPRNMRFRWTETAIRAAETEFPTRVEEAVAKERRKDDAWAVFKTVISAGSLSSSSALGRSE